MHHTAMMDLVAILVLGIGAQWIAWRLKIPSILLLLLTGFFAGPITGFLSPDKLLGDLLLPIVSISVAIILFEGGLSLQISELDNIGKVVRNLILVGVPVTLVLTAAAAHWILGMSMPLAILLGAILVVTGPTVILPLLRSLRISDRVSSILKWEAMLNDPVGAIFAVLVFEATFAGGFQAATGMTAVILTKSVVAGVSLGYITTWIMIQLLKRYLIPDFLHSSFALMMVVTAFFLSNRIQAESGLIAVTMAGFFLANQKRIPVRHIVEFKENLQVLLISSLFIVLAARLEIKHVTQAGWPEVLFLLFMILVCRPLAVFASAWGTEINWREKLYLSWMAPRGIVAAAVSSIFALRLEAAGYPDAEKILAVVFLVIVVTVVLYGITSPWVARLLDISKPNPQGVLFLGAHSWAQKMARALQDEGIPVLLVDTNSTNIYEAHLALLPAVRGNILSHELTDELDLNGIGRFLAMTPNDDVNSVACSQLAEVFERSEVYQLSEENQRRKDQKTASRRAHGRYLFRKDMTYGSMNSLFQRKGSVRKITLTRDYDFEAFRREYEGKALPLFLINEAGHLRVMTASDPPEPKAGHTLIVLLFQPLTEPPRSAAPQA